MDTEFKTIAIQGTVRLSNRAIETLKNIRGMKDMRLPYREAERLGYSIMRMKSYIDLGLVREGISGYYLTRFGEFVLAGREV